MNNIDELIANEIQQEELNSFLLPNNVINDVSDVANFIGASIGLQLLSNNISQSENADENNNDSITETINSLSDNEENITINSIFGIENDSNDENNNDSENESEIDTENEIENNNNINYQNENLETLNDLNENSHNVDNSFMRFAQSMIEFAREGENAFNDNPESIPAQIYDSIFNITPEWRNLSRTPTVHNRNNQRWRDSIGTFRNNESANQTERSFADMFLNLVNTGISSANFLESLNNFSDMTPVSVRLNKDTLNSFPVKKYNEIKNEIETNNSCTICLSNYEDDDLVKELPCSHCFHDDCINTWLSSHSYKCPICRFTLGTSEPIM